MRHLVLEMHCEVIASLRLCDYVESLEILHYLRFDVDGVVAIVRFRPKPGVGLDLKGEHGIRDFRILWSDGNEHVAYIELVPRAWDALPQDGGSVHLVPIRLQGDRLRVGLLGDERSLQRAVAQLRANGLTFRIVSIANARFEANSPLSELTERQRQVLLAAYRHGYYACPRKTNSEQLGRILQLDKSTVAEHLRKAEERLLSTLLGGPDEAPLSRGVAPAERNAPTARSASRHATG